MKKIFIFLIAFVSFLNSKAQCWSSIKTTYDHVLATKLDSTIWGWGLNYTGQVGDGTTSNLKLNPTQIQASYNYIELATGYNQSIGIRSNGSLWTWGFNFYGQLGNGTNVNQSTPINILPTTTWKKVTSGGSYCIAIKSDGTLWGWGYNAEGEIGDGTIINKNIPTSISTLSTWKNLSSNTYHTIAIKNDGTIWGWGRNAWGQIGDSTNIDRHSPVQVGTDTNWNLVETGYDRSFAIKTDGTLWGWGENYSGALGDSSSYQQIGTSTNPPNPIPKKISNDTDWKKVSSGGYHSIALKNNGTIWTVGNNIYGQLGTGDTTDRKVFTQVGNANDWIDIGAGEYFTIALKNDGNIFVWGNNSFAQFGNGDTISSILPINLITSNCSPTSLSEIQNQQLDIYPNPSHGSINIKLKNISQLKTVKLFDMLGRELNVNYEKTQDKCIFENTNLSTGNYILKIITADKTISRKITIEK